MFRNTVQPGMLPSEVAFVEGHDLVHQKKKKGGGDIADEDYFERILKHDLKEQKPYHSNDGDEGDFQFDNSSNIGSSGINDTSSRNDSSGIESGRDSGVESSGESSGTGTSFMGGVGDGFHRMLKGKDGMEFISDIRCCLILGLIAAAATLSIGVYAISKNDQEEDLFVSFETTSFQVFESAEGKIQEVFRELERVSVVTRSFIHQKRLNHPTETEEGILPDGFVTIPDVEYILGSARENMHADFVAYLPSIATQQESEYWTKYSEENVSWIAEATDVYISSAQDAPQRNLALTQLTNSPESVSEEQHGSSQEPDTKSDEVHHDIWKFKVLNEDGSAIDFNSSACPMWSTDKRNSDEEDVLAFDIAAAINASRVLPYFPETVLNADTILSPIWTSSPPYQPGKPNIVNFNAQSDPTFHQTTRVVGITRKTTLDDVCSPTAPWMDHSRFPADRYAMVTTPVFDQIESAGGTDQPILGYFMAVIPWTVFFSDIVGDGHGHPPLKVAVTNGCGRAFTMVVQSGHDVMLLNQTDNGHADSEKFNELMLEMPLAPFAHPQSGDGSTCAFTVSIYPTQAMIEVYTTNKPIVLALVVLVCFVFTSLAFIAFDCMVQRRQKDLVNTARRQNLLISALFPQKIQNQLLAEVKENEAQQAKNQNHNKSGTAGLRQFLEREHQGKCIGDAASWGSMDGRENQTAIKKTKPIADLFPETTVMFADIVGFTAWSSEREPSQVFTLLESIYREFDRIAKRKRVFKVEVVGDCYVAVCGLPDPRKKHAVVMAKFAADCVAAMSLTVKRLQMELGPDTSELKLRVGLHSGPVVAGVLRGDRSRFQLFGDTMNTASRMESTGLPNHIQISQDTADVLRAFGKDVWFAPREDKVEAKGKGTLTTYFLLLEGSDEGETDASSIGQLSSSNGSLAGSRHSKMSFGSSVGNEERRNCSIDWTVEVLAGVLKAMVARRKARSLKPSAEKLLVQLEQASIAHDGTNIAIDGVSSFVALPAFDDADFGMDSSNVILPEVVLSELRDYVQSIAELYNSNNPFHNFDHATHVVLSVNKLLSRINAPDFEGGDEDLYKHTFGITSEPLTWFAVILSALIHDVDHSGVSNDQLVKEKSPLVYLYQNKSVAEQNSFDIGWDLLMEDDYKNLRRAIYTTTGEFKRFRQLTVNSVIATDVFDKDLKRDRQERWDKAFQDDVSPDMMDEFDIQKKVNLKASIVIEHLLQASDVAHTMQHWHIYVKWNERLFMEMYKAFKEGRMEKDPTDIWYKGEIGFFDHYIIPLAKKLKVCGVFGVASTEYLNYAEQNRSEWQVRGERVVAEFAKKAKAKFGRSHDDKKSDDRNSKN